MTLASLKYWLLVCGVFAAAAVFARPVVSHLHAPRPGAAGGSPAKPTPPPEDWFHRFHNYLYELWSGTHVAADAPDDKKDEKPKPLSGTWVKKDGELKLEFAETEMKVYPHGENKVIVIVCEYAIDKDGAVKAKVTGYEGKEEAKKVLAEKLPVGSAFGFTWKAEKGAATLEEVKGEKAEFLKPHLEGGFEEKK